MVEGVAADLVFGINCRDNCLHASNNRLFRSTPMAAKMLYRCCDLLERRETRKVGQREEEENARGRNKNAMFDMVIYPLGGDLS